MINRSGIGTVIQGLLPRLLAAPHKYLLLGDPKCLERYATNSSEIVPFCEPIYSIQEQVRFPRRVLRKNDVLLCPHYNIPLSTFPRIVVIVHDLAHLVFPQFFGGSAKRLYAHFFFRVALRNAIKIITPSEFTHSEIIKRLDIPASRIVTIPNGPGRSFAQWVDLSPDRLKHYGIEIPYVLAVGNIKPHKNLKVLLGAFSIVKQMGDLRLKLVLCGQKFEEQDAGAPFAAWPQERLKAEGVVMTGHVSDDDMPALYHNASLYVTPSLYEGFGLTPLEAIRFGTLPLVADAAALPEVVDDPDLRFDPGEPRNLADMMLSFLNNSALLNRKLSEQRDRIGRFSWDSTAEAYLQILEDAGNEPR
jgi:glycosyltransferase involved in cell wall biosynthesis